VVPGVSLSQAGGRSGRISNWVEGGVAELGKVAPFRKSCGTLESLGVVREHQMLLEDGQLSEQIQTNHLPVHLLVRWSPVLCNLLFDLASMALFPIGKNRRMKKATCLGLKTSGWGLVEVFCRSQDSKAVTFSHDLFRFVHRVVSFDNDHPLKMIRSVVPPVGF